MGSGGTLTVDSTERYRCAAWKLTMQFRGIAIVIALAMTAAPSRAQAAETVFNAEQLVSIAYQSNASIKAARERWMSAQHSIKQAYAPADPIFSYNSSDSPQNPFGPASLRQWSAVQAFQFPGKAGFQTDQARRTAQIARLTYEAALRVKTPMTSYR